MMPAPATTAFGVNMQQPWALTPPAAAQGPQAPAVPRALTPAGGTPGPTALTPPAAPTAAPRPTATSAYTAAAPALAGLQAGQMGLGAYDTKSGVVSALGAAGAGAAAGAMVGGPVGAVVGGGVGLVTGALNAWMSTSQQNKANRERRKLLAEAKAEQARRDKIARDDALDALAFERKELAEQKRLEEWQRNRALIAEASAKKKARADEYIARGYVT
jgi:hypothetical protein